MWLDSQSLDDFYQTPWGQQVQRTLAQALSSLWPKDKADLSEQVIMGLGYTQPYLQSLVKENETALAFLPQRLGPVAWPAKAFDGFHPEARANRINLSANILTDAMPLADQAVNRVLVMHCLEFSRDIAALCEELQQWTQGDTLDRLKPAA